jgi:hypothetical protein
MEDRSIACLLLTQVKGKVVRALTEYRAIKAYGGCGGHAPHIL